MPWYALEMQDIDTDRLAPGLMGRSAAEPVDLLVVGGGINGAGIARDAAGRGLSVMLVEQDDLASHTSSASTKLIHGGLRYLEYGEFRLVRESLIERERLWGMAPHIIWPLRFVLPQNHSPRPSWLVRLGLFVYDHLGGRKKLPGTRMVDLAKSPFGAGLAQRSGKAFIYSDCWVEDSRLVVLNAMSAAEMGAVIRTRTRLVAARREAALWAATLENDGGSACTVRARALVNAAGPWVADVIERSDRVRSKSQVRLVKGSHIVVPRLHEGDHALVLQNPDRRIVFAIPYERRYTLVGTTEEAWTGPSGHPAIDKTEAAYLLDTINRYFARRIAATDIVRSYSGIRPLHDDHSANASAVTRDYVLDLDAGDGMAPMLSVFGGKITTYRKLAEQALAELAPQLRTAGGAWTAGAALPGGDLPGRDFDAYAQGLTARHPGLPPLLVRRLARAYGTRCKEILRDAAVADDLGEDFGGGLHATEVAYLCDREFARSAEDVLWRRGKLGLHVPPGTAQRVEAFIAGRRGA